MDHFTENQNTAIFTTKYIIDQGSPILYIYHFDDGSWQFSGKENTLQDEDYKIISLSEILALDETLKVLGDLPEGYMAKRETSRADWEIESLS
jgi:hypothetical protein